MQQNKIAMMVLAVSFLLIIIFYTLAGYLVMKNIDICKINDQYVGKIVQLNGFVKGLSKTNGNVFFNVENNSCKIKAVLFRSHRIFNTKELKNKEHIQVTGKIEHYLNQNEIIVDHIEILNS